MERKTENLRNCRHEGNYSWIEYDARGIPLGRVCDLCREARLAAYRPEVLTDPHYECDEPVESDEWY